MRTAKVRRRLAFPYRVQRSPLPLDRLLNSKRAFEDKGENRALRCHSRSRVYGFGRDPIRAKGSMQLDIAKGGLQLGPGGIIRRCQDKIV